MTWIWPRLLSKRLCPQAAKPHSNSLAAPLHPGSLCFLSTLSALPIKFSTSWLSTYQVPGIDSPSEALKWTNKSPALQRYSSLLGETDIETVQQCEKGFGTEHVACQFWALLISPLKCLSPWSLSVHLLCYHAFQLPPPHCWTTPSQFPILFHSCPHYSQQPPILNISVPSLIGL